MFFSIHYCFMSFLSFYFFTFYFLLSDFKCGSWHPQEKFGYARELSFQHPIKIYLGMLCCFIFYLHCIIPCSDLDFINLGIILFAN